MGQCLSKGPPPTSASPPPPPPPPVVIKPPPSPPAVPPAQPLPSTEVADAPAAPIKLTEEALSKVSEAGRSEVNDERATEQGRISRVSGATSFGERSGRLKKALLSHASDISDAKKAAYEDFHDQQHRGIYQVRPALEVLADLHLDQVLGSGGFAAVLQGWWRGSTEVAVKIFATPPAPEEARMGWMAQGPSDRKDAGNDNCIPEGLPAKALAEAMLARDLSHPNIVRTFDVRCCQLTPAFMLALSKGSPRLLASTPDASFLGKTMSEAMMRSHGEVSPGQIKLQEMMGGGGGGSTTAGKILPTAAEMGAMLEEIQKYKGITPVWSEEQNSEEATGASEESEENITHDGFGTADPMAKRKAMSWSEVLMRVGGSPGDYITIIVMQHANFGTLWTAIQNGIFVRKPTASINDKRKRLRALLRTAREIAMGMEHLHDCNVVHGDLKPGNVLLNDSRLDARGFTALLADFGLAHIVQGSRHHSKHASGTTSYMAPELFGEGEVSHSTDLYAFGIMLWEMVHGGHAHEGIATPQIIMSVMSGKRPVWAASTEAQLGDLKEIYEKCVLPMPHKRPTAKHLVAELAKVEDKARSESARASKDAAARGGS